MIPQEEPCPVPDALLGDLYRASPERLRALAETIPPHIRARLAAYCHGRGHLAKVGLAMAAGSTYSDAGAAFFAQAFHTPDIQERRRKVTLSRGPLMQVAIDED